MFAVAEKVVVEPAVAITRQPASALLLIGQPLALTVEATGTGALTYQWFKDGSDIPGATSAGYSLANAQLSASGRYRVIVRSPDGRAAVSEFAEPSSYMGPG